MSTFKAAYIYPNFLRNSSGARDVVESNYNNNIPFTTFRVYEPLSVSCSGPATSVEVNQDVTWTATSRGGIGTPSYTWSGENLDNKTGNPVIASYTSAGDKTASVSVTTTGGQTASGTCGPVTITVRPPTNLQLSITGTVTANASRTSGRISDQFGLNHLNPITITLSAHKESADINKFRVEFIATDRSQGFALEYDSNTPKVYAYDPGTNNFNPAQPLVPGINIVLGGKIRIEPLSQNPTLNNSASWRVIFDQTFGSKVMDTKAFVQDTLGLCRSGENQTLDCTPGNFTNP